MSDDKNVFDFHGLSDDEELERLLESVRRDIGEASPEPERPARPQPRREVQGEREVVHTAAGGTRQAPRGGDEHRAQQIRQPRPSAHRAQPVQAPERRPEPEREMPPQRERIPKTSGRRKGAASGWRSASIRWCCS